MILNARLFSFLSLLCVVYIAAFFFASRLHIHIPSLSIMNVMMPVGLCSFIFSAFVFKHQKSYIYPLLSLLAFFLLALSSSIIYGERSQFEDLFYLAHLFLSFCAIYFFMRFGRYSESFLLKLFSSLLFLLALSSLGQVFGIIGIIPMFWAPEGLHNKGFANLVTGPFVNPNDLAVAQLMLFSYVYWVADRLNKRLLKVLIICSTLFVLLVTLSRAAIVLFFIYFVFFSLYKKNFIKLFLMLSTGGALFIALIIYAGTLANEAKGENELLYRNLDRISSIDSLLSSQGSNSSSIRINSYIHFFSNIEKITELKGTDNYRSFYSNGDFDRTVISHNPHSFFIEVSIAFGYVGLFIVSIFVFYLSIYTLLNKDSYSLIPIFLFITLSNIPSSIVKMPVIWVPVFLAYFHQQYYVKKSLN